MNIPSICFLITLIATFSCGLERDKIPNRRLVIMHYNSSNWKLSDTTKLNPWPRSQDNEFTIFLRAKGDFGDRIKLFVFDSIVFNDIGPFESMIVLKDSYRNDLLRLELINQSIEFDIPSEINVVEIMEDSLQVIIAYTP
ncbi:MAG: hypothetical protein ABJH04_01820 [Cyclobacteriaceae bacterium]